MSEHDPAEIPCVIGPRAAFDGLLSFEGAVRVEGQLKGQVVGDGHLEIGPEARVEARIEVRTARVEGSVDGELRARERVELTPSARVRAAVETPSLRVAEGARLEGRVKMTASPEARAKAAPAA